MYLKACFYVMYLVAGAQCEISFKNEFKQLLNLNYDYFVNNSLPEYILEKYERVQAGFYNNNAVYCLPAKKREITANLFKFNLTGFRVNRIFRAELHVFRLKQPIDILLRTYQLNSDNLINPDLHQLISVQYINNDYNGWHVFNIKKSVETWLNDSKTNHGLFLTTTTTNNERISEKSNEAFLVIFDATSFEIPAPDVTPMSNVTSSTCNLQNMDVNLDLPNIILPKSFKANKCVGDCHAPFYATNYARLFKLNSCCVPVQLAPLTVLYYDGNFIILREISGMVVKKCGCL